MTRFDYLCMACAAGLLGSLTWALFTLDVVPAFIAAGVAIIVSHVGMAGEEA